MPCFVLNFDSSIIAKALTLFKIYFRSVRLFLFISKLYAECVNMDVDAATGRLRTVEGTIDILSDTEIFAVIYDSINSLMLVVDANKKIRLADFSGNINFDTVIYSNSRIFNSLYGNVKPEDIAAQVSSEIHRLPKNAQVRYLPPLYQVWCIGRDGYILVYDIRFKAWFKRQLNAAVLDVFSVGDEVYIVKADRVSKLDKGTFKDNGDWLSWKFLAQRMVSHQDFLLKRTKISVTMLNSERYNGQIFCGKVVLPLPIPNREMKIYEDDSPIYRNKTKLNGHGRIRGHTLPQPPNDKIFWSEENLQDNRHKIFSNNTFEIQSKNYFRSHYLDIGGHGTGGRFILQSIIMDIAEV